MFHGAGMRPMMTGPTGPGMDTGARADARAAADAAALMQHHVERLLMISEALWGMLKEQHGYTDEDLVERVREIDLRDGKLDGKVAAAGVKTCPSCKRRVSGRHAVCLYCGGALSGDLFDR